MYSQNQRTSKNSYNSTFNFKKPILQGFKCPCKALLFPFISSLCGIMAEDFRTSTFAHIHPTSLRSREPFLCILTDCSRPPTGSWSSFFYCLKALIVRKSWYHHIPRRVSNPSLKLSRVWFKEDFHNNNVLVLKQGDGFAQFSLCSLCLP